MGVENILSFRYLSILLWSDVSVSLCPSTADEYSLYSDLSSKIPACYRPEYGSLSSKGDAERVGLEPALLQSIRDMTNISGMENVPVNGQ